MMPLKMENHPIVEMPENIEQKEIIGYFGAIFKEMQQNATNKASQIQF